MAQQFNPQTVKKAAVANSTGRKRGPKTAPTLPVNNNWGGMTSLAQRIEWLKNNPAFDEVPATMEEFLGPRYLDIDPTQNSGLQKGVGIRPGVKKALIDIFGKGVDPNSISLIKRGMFTGGIGVGKQFDLDELILTPHGWKKNQDLKVGDQVIGKDGKGTNVVAIFDNDSVDRFRVHFKDGTWINAGGDHKWEVQEKKHARDKSTQKLKRISVKRVMDTRELAGKNLRNGHDSWKYSIPLVDPVEFSLPFEELVDAYTLGWYISNGYSASGSPKIGFHEDDLDYLKRSLIVSGCYNYTDQQSTKRGGNLVYCANSNHKRKFSNPFAHALNVLGLFGVHSLEKFIPESYKFAPVNVRLELLRGLMDSDGCANVGNRSQFSTGSRMLANDVADLVRGLGGYCTVTSFERFNTEYIVHVNMGDVCPFKMPRKADKWKPRTNQKPNRAIVKIERIEDGPGRCIMVDNPDHLYVAKDYIVSHNSTLASIALTYMVHWVSCLHDPQGYFGLLPGSRIAFMMMSTRASHAQEVLFGDIKARINSCEWFKKNCPHDEKLTKQLRFPKDIWIIPGTSQETSVEGYNVLCGIIDEGDSHKVTQEKDYAEEAWNTIHGRIASRFTDPVIQDHRGLLLAIGQMKKANGFMAKKKHDLLTDGKPNQLVVEMTIWDSLGWDRFMKGNQRDSFFFDIVRKKQATSAQAYGAGKNIIEIPNAYFKDFDNDPIRALKDHAGIPPAVEDPFITLIDRVDEAQDKWAERFKDKYKYTVDSSCTMPQFHPDFEADSILKRAVHVDIAFAPGGDAMGMAMGHIPELVEIDGELKPRIVFDFLLRMKPSGGDALQLADFRKILYHLRDDLKFKIGVVTFDGFNSMDSIQILRKKHFNVGEMSVDRTKAPYEELREAIYERRIEFPKYMTYLTRADTDKVNIARLELSELQDTGRKIDHPPKGSKDIADAMAGVVYDLMSNVSFRRGSKRDITEQRIAEDEMEYNSKVLGDSFSLSQDEFAELSDLLSAEPGNPRNPISAGRPGYGLPPIEKDPFGLAGLNMP
ncbi:DarB-like antirestriction [Gordonia phage Gmala1]|uniref:TerL n=1 Tax=Gordonia phage Gmala1 TaxID=1622190 RepID=A0A0E3T7W2_9CAUD|nr:DarB-like antirestriction [Gordonia phage Gmala1]AKC02840.1 TerL [Gordonia phage Gmala1]